MHSSKFRSILMSILLPALFIISCSDKDSPGKYYLNFRMETINQKSDECTSEDSKCAEIHLRYPVFVDDGNSRIFSLNKFFLELIINGGYEESDNSSTDDLCKAFFDDYNSMLEDFKDYTLVWKLERMVDIVHNSQNYISIKYHEYSFTGGAHPNYTTTFFTYDLNRQKFILLKDLFPDPAKLESLTQMVEKEFRMQKNILPEADLGKEGYWFENNKFSLNENFAISDSGIVFFFNAYEIAPYSLGETELFLPYNQLNYIMPTTFEK